MDNTARHYRDRYNEAAEHLFQGRKDVALDICWELRLKPDLGIFRRAAVNLLIATLVDNDKLKYAEECLDLIDILRQEKGSVGARTEKMETVAQDYIDQISGPQPTLPAAYDPATGMLSDPVERGSQAGSNAASEDEPQQTPNNVVVRPWTLLSTANDNVKKTIDNTINIEGYLRDPKLHKPRVKKSSDVTMTDGKTNDCLSTSPSTRSLC